MPNAALVDHLLTHSVRTGDFTTWTRALTLPDPTDLAETVVRAAREMFRERIRLGGRGVRLLGVGASGLEPASSAPAPLFRDPSEERLRTATRAADEARDSFGEESVVRARLMRRRPKTS